MDKMYNIRNMSIIGKGKAVTGTHSLFTKAAGIDTDTRIDDIRVKPP